MNSFIVFVGLLAIAAAMPFEGSVSHSQDTIGNYKLDIDTKESNRKEEGHQDGSVVGSYTFTDTDGIIHHIRFVSGASGYIATGADIPSQVAETAEVAAVRAAHQREFERVRALLPVEPQEHEVLQFAPAPTFQFVPQFVPQFVAVPHHELVDNTAEINAERAAHFAAHQQAIDRLNQEYAKVAHLL